MTVLTVGIGQQYSTIEAAVNASSSNDTINVQKGTYTNDFLSITHNLTLDAVGGMVSLVATVAPPNEKGLIDEGDNGVSVSVTGFELSGVSISDANGANGAGIRYEGGTLTLANDYIHNNQDGLLANADPAGRISIVNTEFADNGTASGAGAGYDHNLYVGAIGSLTVNQSYFTGAVVGHEIKSRAASTTITNSRIQDGPGGTASYDIDLPNGGAATISGNTIEKSATAENPVVISYGEEGNLSAGSSLLVSGNIILNDLASPSSVAVRNSSTVDAMVTNNQFYGLSPAQVASGNAAATGNTVLGSEPRLDTSAPYVTSTSATVSMHTLVLRLGEDAWKGNASFILTIDGHQASATQTVTALQGEGQSQAFTYTESLSAGTHTVGVTFLNDLYGGSTATDRNLYVDGVSFDGKQYLSSVQPLLYTNSTSNVIVGGSAPAAFAASGALPGIVLPNTIHVLLAAST